MRTAKAGDFTTHTDMTVGVSTVRFSADDSSDTVNAGAFFKASMAVIWPNRFELFNCSRKVGISGSTANQHLQSDNSMVQSTLFFIV